MNYLQLITLLLSVTKKKMPLSFLFNMYKKVLTTMNEMTAKIMVFRFKKSLSKEDQVLFNEIMHQLLSGKQVRKANIFDFLLGRKTKQNKLHDIATKFNDFLTNKKWYKL